MKKKITKMLVTLEKAEFFIVDLYFYGSGCYPLGRGRIHDFTGSCKNGRYHDVPVMYLRDQTNSTRLEKESGKYADK